MIRLVYRAVFHKLSAAFIVSAVITAVWGEQRYFSYGLALMASFYLLSGWICLMESYGISLRLLDRFRKKNSPVPYALRNHQTVRQLRRRPLFAQDFNDFDDDLTSRTAVAPDNPKEASSQRMLSGFICAGLLFVLSFL